MPPQNTQYCPQHEQQFHVVHSYGPSLCLLFAVAGLCHPYSKPLKESAWIFSSLVLCKDRVNGVGGQGHRKRLETVNPTLCHLSDERIPTEFGMYKKNAFLLVWYLFLNCQPAALLIMMSWTLLSGVWIAMNEKKYFIGFFLFAWRRAMRLKSFTQCNM